jgi:hypothetical protein
MPETAHSIALRKNVGSFYLAIVMADDRILKEVRRIRPEKKNTFFCVFEM